jgi:hypothetical protein
MRVAAGIWRQTGCQGGCRGFKSLQPLQLRVSASAAGGYPGPAVPSEPSARPILSDNCPGPLRAARSHAPIVGGRTAAHREVQQLPATGSHVLSSSHLSADARDIQSVQHHRLAHSVVLGDTRRIPPLLARVEQGCPGQKEATAQPVRLVLLFTAIGMQHEVPILRDVHPSGFMARVALTRHYARVAGERITWQVVRKPSMETVDRIDLENNPRAGGAQTSPPEPHCGKSNGHQGGDSERLSISSSPSAASEAGS